MRKVLTLVIALMIIHCSYGQEMFRLTDDEPHLLNVGWKYKMVDDPTFALQQYNDQGWKSIKADLDVHNSLPKDAKTGIGWMRLKFFVGKELRGKILSIRIHQSVASEIFLNGKFLTSFGVLNVDPKKVKAYDPIYLPINFPLSNDNIQVVSVRFAVQPGILYSRIFESPNELMSMEVMSSQSALNSYKHIYVFEHSFLFLQIGIMIMIFIIHFSFFILDPSQKANLYFSMFALCYLFVAIFQINYYVYCHHVATKFFLGNFSFLLILAGTLLITKAIYSFLQRKIDFYYKFLLGYGILAVFLNMYPYGYGWQIGGPICEVLAFINLVRISFLAVKQGELRARVIAIGAIATIILFIIFILQGTFTNRSFLQSLDLKRLSTYLLFVLSLPAAASYLLAKDFAVTSKRLSQKLEEVKDLSQQNLAIEKEKQQILASQNQQLELQVKERTAALSQSLEELKSTQTQLIQSEKMASLGELTAGIAHEIQNPLNFVNNFSEVNMELSDEIIDAVKQGDLPAIGQLATDIKSNQEKILEHGHRADGIVKSMLQHSRSSTGIKEPIDINALVDEYARLSYHGLKAKDKSFNVTFKADYDPNAGSCNIIPQDIGRVLLNLFNNAFYAVSEKNIDLVSVKINVTPLFEPTVSVSTKRIDEQIRIIVRDNGSGIPEKIKEKIFQPFFTTKPTGLGTGLGLSLSYDIISQGHSGHLEVQTEEGEFTEFIIHIPVG